MKFFKEFKEFIAKGNAMDLAVGVVIGGAFTAIVNSLVENVINPFIGFVVGLIASGATAVGGGDAVDAIMSMDKWVIPGTEIAIGAFIGSIINFLIIAFVIFCVVKAINNMREKAAHNKEEESAAPAGPTQEELLAEIRDLLKDNRK